MEFRHIEYFVETYGHSSFSQAAGFEPTKAVISSDATQIYKLVERGAGVFLGIGAHVREVYPHVALVPLEEPIDFRMGFVCQHFGLLPAPAKAFVEHVLDAYAAKGA